MPNNVKAQQTKVSVIIPVYNAERYLRQCVDSVLSQTLRELEVILVDDGSVDRSGEICDEYARANGRVRVIHKQNGGAGFARNAGLESAKGEYVTFLDSDDYIDPDMYAVMYRRAKEAQADICCCGMRRVKDGVILKTGDTVGTDRIYRGKEELRRVLLDFLGPEVSSAKEQRLLGASSCTALFSIKPIREYGLRFMSEREVLSEDTMFKLEYLTHITCICVLSNVFYNYRITQGSLSTTYSDTRITRACAMYREQLRILKDLSIDYKQGKQRIQRMFLMNARIDAKRNSLSAASYREARADLIRLASMPELQEILAEYPWRKTPVKYRVFNFCFAHRLVFPLYFFSRLSRYLTYGFLRRHAVTASRQ